MAVRRRRPVDLAVVPFGQPEGTMMSQTQGAAVPVSTRVPQWPPKQATASASHSSWLARCANNSGRQVEWPPRFEDQYGSQPTLSSSYLSNSRDKVSEPRPLYSSLRKAHSSTPNLFNIAQKPPRPPNSHTKVQPKQIKQEQPPPAPITQPSNPEIFSEYLTPETPNLADQSAMSTSVSSNSTTQHVRVNQTSTQNIQYQQPQVVTKVVQKQTTQVKEINIPVQYDPSNQQQALQQMQRNQPLFQPQFIPQQPNAFREFNVPIQLSNSPSNLSNPPNPNLVQSQNPPNNSVPLQEVSFGPTEPINLGAKGPATPGTVNVPMKFEGPPSSEVKEWPPQLPEDDQPNLTTFYPSNFKLRGEMPVEQQGSQVVVSQPAFKMTKPMKMRGDNKWPPAADGEETTQQEVREFIKPRKQTKDYSGFFAKHSLPANYTGYRAPPGTQHVGATEDEGASDM